MVRAKRLSVDERGSRVICGSWRAARQHAALITSETLARAASGCRAGDLGEGTRQTASFRRPSGVGLMQASVLRFSGWDW